MRFLGVCRLVGVWLPSPAASLLRLSRSFALSRLNQHVWAYVQGTSSHRFIFEVSESQSYTNILSSKNKSMKWKVWKATRSCRLEVLIIDHRGSATSSLYPELTLNMLFDKYLSMLFFFNSKPEKELFLFFFFFYLWCNNFFSPRQERLPERGEDPVSLEGPEHNQAAGSVCEQWSALHGHRIHGVWRLEPVFVPTSASGQNWTFTQYANHQVGHANKCTHILKSTHRRTQSNSFYFLPSVISSLQLPSAHFHGQPDCVRNEVPLLA